jgi:cell wall-associated NlpC family hydrolase
MTVQPISKVASGASLTPGERRQYKVICAALWCYYHKDRISYGALRGKELLDECKVPPFIPSAFDCSGFATYCYKISGAPDPNGNSYSGQGSTASLWGNGRIIGDANVKEGAMHPGDLVFYAYDGPLHGGNSEHVSVYIDEGFVISMGNDDGPSLLNYKKETKPVYGVRRYDF